MLEHGYDAFLNRPIHAFCNTVLLRTIGFRIFTSNVAFLEKFDEFFRLELSSIVGSKTFQLSTRLVFDHGELFLEDREHSIFCSGRICPHLSRRVINETDEVGGATKGLMWHWTTNVPVDSILLVLLSGVKLRHVCHTDNAHRTDDPRRRVWGCIRLRLWIDA